MRRAVSLFLLLAITAVGCGKRPGSGSATGTGTETEKAVATATPDLPGEMTEEERRAQPRVATPTPTPVPTATPVERRSSDVPVETVLWTRDTPLAAQDYEVAPKDGVLRKVTAPATDADQTRFFPYALDYWGIVGSGELDAVLGSHVGRDLRIEGHFRKVYDDGKWTYEVEPKRIILLPAK